MVTISLICPPRITACTLTVPPGVAISQISETSLFQAVVHNKELQGGMGEEEEKVEKYTQMQFTIWLLFIILLTLSALLQAL